MEKSIQRAYRKLTQEEVAECAVYKSMITVKEIEDEIGMILPVEVDPLTQFMDDVYERSANNPNNWEIVDYRSEDSTFIVVVFEEPTGAGRHLLDILMADVDFYSYFSVVAMEGNRMVLVDYSGNVAYVYQDHLDLASRGKMWTALRYVDPHVELNEKDESLS